MERWRTLTEWPLMLLAVAYLAVYSWEVLSPQTIPEGPASAALQAIWIAFAVHYAVSLILAPAKRSWFLRNLHELAIVALPMLRPLRLLRLLATLNVINKIAGTALRGRVLIYVTGGSALLVYIAALAMYDAEAGHPDSLITRFGDAVWWAIVSVTTVGYGDLYPVTLTGRLIAIGLMIYGIALLGVVTATLASWIIEQVAAEEEKSTAATEAHIDRLGAEIAELRRFLTDGTQRPS